MLRVVPERGDGVAVVIAHHETGGREGAGPTRASAASEFRKEVGLAAVVRALLRRVEVRLVGGGGLRSIEAERIRGAIAVLRIPRVWVVREELAAKSIAGRRVRRRGERRFAGRIDRNGIDAEVVIVGDVLAVHDDKMPDRRGRSHRGGGFGAGRTSNRQRGADDRYGAYVSHPLGGVEMVWQEYVLRARPIPIGVITHSRHVRGRLGRDSI